jgi:hypothetical protein
MLLLQFLKALLRQWWALMSCAVFTIIGIWAAARGKSNTWTVEISFAAAAFLLLMAAYRAWKEEYVQNRNGPRIMMEWISKSSSTHTGGDIVRLTNCGHSFAANISMEKFSLPEIKLFRFKDVQSLKPGDHVEIPVSLAIERSPHDHVLESMSRFLLEHELMKSPASVNVEVCFSDVNQTCFIQTFEFRRQDSRDSEVMVSSIGRLKVKRS